MQVASLLRQQRATTVVVISQSDHPGGPSSTEEITPGVNVGLTVLDVTLPLPHGVAARTGVSGLM